MSLDLDQRHRAMLQEMGVRVWQPLPEAPNEASPAQVTAPQVATPQAAFASARPVEPAPQPQARTVALSEPVRPLAMPAQAGALGALDWAALQERVTTCQSCELCQGRRQSVFGVGDTRARWLVVGEAPGENEDLQGEPFVGQAGQLLDNMLKALGLSRTAQGAQAVYIANVIKCRPPANRNPQPQEVQQCTPYLQRQIELLQPQIILALGRFAAQALLQSTVPDVASVPLGRLRGQVHRYGAVPVVVSYHPAYLLRTPQDKAKAWADLCLARATVDAG